MKECNTVKQSPLAGLAAYGGGPGSILFGRKGVDGYSIQRSLRFNDDDSAYLIKSFSGTGNQKTWTLSMWVKRGNVGLPDTYLFESAGTTPELTGAYFDSSDKIYFRAYTNQFTWRLQTTRVFRDPSAWYHLVFVFDSTNSTSSDRVRLYVNGTRETAFDNAQYPSINHNSGWNYTGNKYIGAYFNPSNYFDGCIADVHSIDGQALEPTAFGEFNSAGIWDPKEYTGSFGTNGFYLKFDDPTDLGDDESGNNNDFTPNGFVGVLGADVSIANATGALPIRNTTGTYGGTVASGNRTDSQSGLQLAMPLRNALNDESGNSYTITNTGVTFTSYHSKFYGQSAAFFDSDKVNISNASGLGSFGTGDFTVEVYVKFIDNGHYYGRIIEFGGVNNNAFVVDGTTAPFRLRYDAAGSTLYGTSGTIPLGKWTHVAVVRNSGTLKFYVDGVEGGSHSSSHNLAGGSAQIGNYLGSQLDFDGYMQDLRVYSSAKYTSNFTPPNNPTNALPSEALDSLFDSPTDGTQSDTGAGGEVSSSYATLNPLVPRTNTTYSNGNLQLASGGNYRSGVATIGINGGKFYFEGQVLTNPDNGFSMIGITTLPNYFNYPGSNGDDDGFGWYSGTGQLYFNDALGATYSSWTVGDIVSVAYDSATRRTWIAKNGTWQNSGNPAAGTGYVHTSSGTLPVFFSIATGTNGVVAANFGQRAFAHTAPSGFKALCTKNLPTPTIADGSDYFDVSLWTGDGNTGRNITGLSFSPDLTWIKSRSLAKAHALFDTVRGANKRLQSNSTNAETTHTDQLSAFISNGFTVEDNNTVNQNGATYAGWSWDAGANSNKTYAVKVVSDSGNKYRFDDFGTSAVTLDLEEGSTYIFDQSDSSNSGHPLRFSTTANGTHGGGTEYTTGVTVTGTPGQAGAKTTIVVAASAPTLFYYCSVHSGMGGQANTNSTAGASNFDGSIQSTAKANQTSGFSIVTYTGAGSTATIGHGLNAEPHWVIVKPRNGTTTYGWRVYHKSIGNTKHLRLDTTSDGSVYSDWNDTTPTSSVISLNGGPAGTVNVNGTDYLCYAWAPIEGYSAFGSYTGNGSTDGPFVHTQFRPRFVIIKNTNLSTQNWYILDSERDSYNLTANKLEPNTTNTENASPNTATTNALDFLSNGFKFRTSNDGTNQNNASYVYAAFAEHPFKTARAR